MNGGRGRACVRSRGRGRGRGRRRDGGGGAPPAAREPPAIAPHFLLKSLAETPAVLARVVLMAGVCVRQQVSVCINARTGAVAPPFDAATVQRAGRRWSFGCEQALPATNGQPEAKSPPPSH